MEVWMGPISYPSYPAPITCYVMCCSQYHRNSSPCSMSYSNPCCLSCTAPHVWGLSGTHIGLCRAAKFSLVVCPDLSIGWGRLLLIDLEQMMGGRWLSLSLPGPWSNLPQLLLLQELEGVHIFRWAWMLTEWGHGLSQVHLWL